MAYEQTGLNVTTICGESNMQKQEYTSVLHYRTTNITYKLTDILGNETVRCWVVWWHKYRNIFRANQSTCSNYRHL